MTILSKLNRQSLEDGLDTIIGKIRGCIGDTNLDMSAIDNIYFFVEEDTRYSKNLTLRRYPHDPTPPNELTVEAQTVQKEIMFRRHGKFLQKLYDRALPFEDNLPSLGFPNETTKKLRWLMHHYEQLTNNKLGYNPIIL